MAEELQVRIGADASDLIDETKRASRAFDNMADNLADASREATKAVDRPRDALGRFVKRAKDGERAAKGVGSSFDDLAAAAKRSAERVRELANRAGKIGVRGITRGFQELAGVLGTITKVAGAAGVALAGIATASAVSFARFEDKFAQVRTLIDDTANVDIPALADGLRDLSNRFGVDLLEATNAAYNAISAGQDPARVLEFLEASFKGAAAGAASTGEAVDLFTTVLNAFGKAAGSTEKVADVLFATIKAGKTTASELAASIGQVAPVAASASVSLEETGAALATLTASGLNTAEAATALKATLTGILKPSDDAARALNRIGVNADSLAESGLDDAITKVRDAVQQGNGELVDFFPNVRALVGVATLAGEGFDKFGDSLRLTTEAAGAATEAFDKTATTTAFAFATLRRTVEDTFREIGQVLDPFVKRGIGAFQEFADNARSEVEVLGAVLQRRLIPVLESVFGTLEDESRKSGGVASKALRLVADGFDALAEGAAAAAPTIATIATTIETLGDVAEVVLRTLQVGFGTVFSIIANEVNDFLDVAADLAETLDLDLAPSIRSAQEATEAFTQGLIRDTVEAAQKNAEAFEDLTDVFSTYDGTIRTVNEFTSAVRDAGEATRELAKDVDLERAAKSSEQALKSLSTVTGNARSAIDSLAQAFGLTGFTDVEAAANQANDAIQSLGAAFGLAVPEFEAAKEAQEDSALATNKATEALTAYDDAVTASKTTAELFNEVLARAEVAAKVQAAATDTLTDSVDRLRAGSGTAGSSFDRVKVSTDQVTTSLGQQQAGFQALEGSVRQATPKLDAFGGALERVRAESVLTREGLVLIQTQLQGPFQAAGDAAALALSKGETRAREFRTRIEELVKAQTSFRLGLNELLTPLRELGTGFKALSERAAEARAAIGERLRQGFDEFRQGLGDTEADTGALIERIRELGRTQAELSGLNDVAVAAFDRLEQANSRVADSVLDAAKNLSEEFRPELNALLEAFLKLDDFGPEELAEGIRQLNEESGRLKDLQLSDVALSFAVGIDAVAESAGNATRSVQNLTRAVEDARRTSQRLGGETQAEVNERFSGFGFGIQPGRTVGRTTIGEGVFQDGGPVLRTGNPTVEAGEFVLSQRGVSDLGQLIGDLLNRGRAESVVNMTNNFSMRSDLGAQGDDAINDLAFKLKPALFRAGRLAASKSPVT